MLYNTPRNCKSESPKPKLVGPSSVATCRGPYWLDFSEFHLSNYEHSTMYGAKLETMNLSFLVLTVCLMVWKLFQNMNKHEENENIQYLKGFSLIKFKSQNILSLQNFGCTIWTTNCVQHLTSLIFILNNIGSPQGICFVL